MFLTPLLLQLWMHSSVTFYIYYSLHILCLQGRGHFLHLWFNFICVFFSHKIISSALAWKLFYLSHYSILHTSQALYSNFFLFWITAKQTFGHAEWTTSQTMDDCFCLLMYSLLIILRLIHLMSTTVSLLTYLCRDLPLYHILVTISTCSIQKDAQVFLFEDFHKTTH